MFTNMYAAYGALSPKMQALLEGLDGVHDATLIKGFKRRSPETMAEQRRLNPPIAHPVVRVHPETGRKALYVSERVRQFAGMTEEESRPLLDFLNAHVAQPEFVYRHRWSVGDLVMWDNRCTMHVALADYDVDSETRVMLRTTTLGDRSGYMYGDAESGAVATRRNRWPIFSGWASCCATGSRSSPARRAGWPRDRRALRRRRREGRRRRPQCRRSSCITARRPRGRHAIAADIAQADAVQRLVAETRERFARIDVLAHFAGITRDAFLRR